MEHAATDRPLAERPLDELEAMWEVAKAAERS